jgi:hypothetical protein
MNYSCLPYDSSTLQTNWDQTNAGLNILSRDYRRFWIDDRIYWALWHSAWLFTVTHTLVFTVKYSLAVARQRLPTADVPHTLGSLTVPVPQIPASNSNNSLTHRPTLFTNSTQPKPQLPYDWKFTANQFVLAPSPLRLKTTDFFCNWTLLVIVLM